MAAEGGWPFAVRMSHVVSKLPARTVMVFSELGNAGAVVAILNCESGGNTNSDF